MATKEKVAEKPKKVNDITEESVKSQLEGKVEYHNKLIAEKERLLSELNKLETALNQNLGSINTLRGLHKEHFVTEEPSVNGEA